MIPWLSSTHEGLNSSVSKTLHRTGR